MLRSSLGIVLAVSLAIFMAAPATAQIETADRTQINLQGIGLVGGETTFVSATVGVTRFVTQGLELGGDIQGSFGDFESYYLQGRGRFNFVTQSLFVPFLSASAGVQVLELQDPLTGESSTESSFAATAGAGFRRFINENVSFNGEGLALIAEGADGNYEVQDTVLITFGLSVFF